MQIRINRSQTNRQSWQHKAGAPLINRHELKIQNNCFLKKYISEHGWNSKLPLQKIHFTTWHFKLLLQKTFLSNACLDNYSVSDFNSGFNSVLIQCQILTLNPILILTLIQPLLIWSFFSFSFGILILLNKPADNFSFSFS